MLKGAAIGRLVADPQLHEIKKNDLTYKVCEFRLACQQRKDSVDFIKITAWRGMGDFIFNHVVKGQKVAITGRLHVPPFDKEKGRAYEPYIVCSEFEFADSKRKEPRGTPPQEGPGPDDDELYDTLSEDDLMNSGKETAE
jgi:single-stranded DNA-binding protein